MTVSVNGSGSPSGMHQGHPCGGNASGPPFTALIGLIDGIADPVRLGLVRCLTERSQATAAELSGLCQASGPTVRRHLEALVASGIVAEAAGESDGATPGRPPARFSLRPEARESLFAFLGLIAPGHLLASGCSQSEFELAGRLTDRMAS